MTSSESHYLLNFLLLIIIGILYPMGEPILPHLLRYSPFVVKDHNFMCCALHLQQAWLVNNPRPPELFIKIADRINIISTSFDRSPWNNIYQSNSLSKKSL